ncbi:MAG: response regulator [Micromonosporaceae bacterium]|nr:response regulator [Micromonosporaceae bacterium]
MSDSKTALPRVMFVDDEKHLLQGVSRQVRGMVDAEFVTSPIVAAQMLEESVVRGVGSFAAVVSDMRMPGMDGAALLKHARTVCPDTTRLLLTGYADIESAIAAVNEGNIFRFLTKPCSTPALQAALVDAIEQNQLIRDRRELLELTLRGAVEALVETLSMTHPAAFSRATRLRRIAREVADRLGLTDGWRIEVAAQLGEIGVVTLPPEALEALTRGVPANAAVASMLEALPDLADGVLSRIPRLEVVREIVRAQEPVDRPDLARLAAASKAARALQAVREFDAMIARGYDQDSALELMWQRARHDDDILDALQSVVSANQGVQIREVDVDFLRPGIVLAADVRTDQGVLLASHGHVLTEELLARIRNFAALGGLESRPLILVRDTPPEGISGPP